jgi:D-glycero-alpha-D-manno-heptose-7-phosphate kinase
MIVVRSPFRISFVGGGSDIAAFYRRFGGAVVSTTIDKYMYIVIHPYFNPKIRVKYSRVEDVDRIEDIQHPIVRECLMRQRIPKGMEIASFADVPAGSGLGSSSAFTVGLLHALEAQSGRHTSADDLAAAACDVEIERLQEPIGKQDQYASAFGGLNYIEFHPDDTVSVHPIEVSHHVLREFEHRLLMFYVGQERSAGSILGSQSVNMGDPAFAGRVASMVELAQEFRCALERGNLAACGDLLNENWRLKRELANGVSSMLVDRVYDRAMTAGATGGKLLGAGTGGFLLLYCEPSRQESVRQALSEFREMRVQFSNSGSQVIFSDYSEPPGEEARFTPLEVLGYR